MGTTLCGNRQMQKAIILAQVALYVAVLVPVLSDEILKLNGMDIGLWGWAMSLAGPVLTLLLCELAKIITYYQAKWYDQRVRNQRQQQLEMQMQAAQDAKNFAAAQAGTNTLLTSQQQQPLENGATKAEEKTGTATEI